MHTQKKKRARSVIRARASRQKPKANSSIVGASKNSRKHRLKSIIRPLTNRFADAKSRKAELAVLAALQVYKIRLRSRVTINADGCWIFSKTKGCEGYGQLAVQRVLVHAHRIGLMLRTGKPIAANREASHVCGNRSCCNPQHLRAETHRQNIARRRKAAHGQT